MQPLDIYKQACSLNLDHLAITDHHSINAYLELKAYFNSKKSESTTKLWSGIEISSILKGCLVHILGLGFDPKSSFILPYTQGESAIGAALRANKVIEAIHKSNGLAILAHPGRYRLNFKELIDVAFSLGIDGVEVWYDYEFSTKWKVSEVLCNSIQKYCKTYSLLETCGTDTHGYSLLSR